MQRTGAAEVAHGRAQATLSPDVDQELGVSELGESNECLLCVLRSHCDIERSFSLGGRWHKNENLQISSLLNHITK